MGEAERAKRYRELAIEVLHAAESMESEKQRLALIAIAAAYQDVAGKIEQSAEGRGNGFAGTDRDAGAVQFLRRDPR